jgi:hypothetical protein
MLTVVMRTVTLNHKQYNLSDKTQRGQYWADYLQHHLVGKTIELYSYFSKQELEQLDWNANASCLCVEFTDGTVIFPSKDDEGNDAGHFSIRSSAKDLNLVGAIVISAGYLTSQQCDQVGFDSRAPYMRLKTKKGENVLMIAQSDAEGNDAGAIFGSNSAKDELTFPVLDR